MPADRIEKLPLNIAKRRDRLPGARSLANHHAVIGLPEADEQRRRAGVMLHHGVQILVERCLQTRAVARLCGRDARRERSDQKITGRMHWRNLRPTFCPNLYSVCQVTSATSR